MEELYPRAGIGCGGAFSRRHTHQTRGFSLPELLIVIVIGGILTAMAVPAYRNTMTSMQLNSTASGLSGVISTTRFQAVMTSQVYTLAVAVPANSYVVKNVSSGVAAAAVPLPSSLVAVNGGTAATYTFTFCPNGTVFGAGGTCPNANAIPALALTYKGREIDLNVSGVGNVAKTIVH